MERPDPYTPMSPPQKPIGTPMTPAEKGEFDKRDDQQPPIQGPK